MPMTQEYRRSSQRDQVALPLRLGDGGAGMTRDLSASGAFILLDSELALGNEIELSIDCELDRQRIKLVCKGTVVRLESDSGRKGVAVKFLDTRIESFDPAPN